MFASLVGLHKRGVAGRLPGTMALSRPAAVGETLAANDDEELRVLFASVASALQAIYF